MAVCYKDVQQKTFLGDLELGLLPRIAELYHAAGMQPVTNAQGTMFQAKCRCKVKKNALNKCETIIDEILDTPGVSSGMASCSESRLRVEGSYPKKNGKQVHPPQKDNWTKDRQRDSWAKDRQKSTEDTGQKRSWNPFSKYCWKRLISDLRRKKKEDNNETPEDSPLPSARRFKDPYRKESWHKEHSDKGSLDDLLAWPPAPSGERTPPITPAFPRNYSERRFSVQEDLRNLPGSYDLPDVVRSRKGDRMVQPSGCPATLDSGGATAANSVTIYVPQRSADDGTSVTLENAVVHNPRSSKLAGHLGLHFSERFADSVATATRPTGQSNASRARQVEPVGSPVPSILSERRHSLGSWNSYNRSNRKKLKSDEDVDQPKSPSSLSPYSTPSTPDQSPSKRTDRHDDDNNNNNNLNLIPTKFNRALHKLADSPKHWFSNQQAKDQDQDSDLESQIRAIEEDLTEGDRLGLRSTRYNRSNSISFMFDASPKFDSKRSSVDFPALSPSLGSVNKLKVTPRAERLVVRSQSLPQTPRSDNLDAEIRGILGDQVPTPTTPRPLSPKTFIREYCHGMEVDWNKWVRSTTPHIQQDEGYGSMKAGMNRGRSNAVLKRTISFEHRSQEDIEGFDPLKFKVVNAANRQGKSPSPSYTKCAPISSPIDLENNNGDESKPYSSRSSGRLEDIPAPTYDEAEEKLIQSIEQEFK